MEFERIEVSTRDEYKGAQEPVSFVWRGKKFAVEQIVDRWYEGRMDATRMPMLYFRVKTLSGEIFMLRYHEFFRSWSIATHRAGGIAKNHRGGLHFFTNFIHVVHNVHFVHK